MTERKPTPEMIEVAALAMWNESCVLGDPIAAHDLSEVQIYETQAENNEATLNVCRALASAALKSVFGEVLTPWRPISEAPKDGTEVMLYAPNIICGGMSSDRWNAKLNQWDVASDGQPTHWMPLPAAPEVNDE
ncbi:DUF551 domain-containing protein [Acetobacter oeni]|uniref:DUF551 domain-containing protein n=1 Tax=Acetobacter oeni TaxID=304077 RepID=A0A511XKW6_9PROT|nr:DUF551 domain-containing protein [Acetobacter oeni]MBB3883812.1 hypothetical protein [Acetobacter oeni]NHO19845.1 DUF551 domain-containing protein [Acetobacter oeni]GBR10481.1 hypothetical protein AA21952_3088 [Acetobacter oeni LMG 21952]GEN63566.1 hypothetical protein AOE01nite_17900 [Acetobacter oeni]